MNSSLKIDAFTPYIAHKLNIATDVFLMLI